MKRIVSIPLIFIFSLVLLLPFMVNIESAYGQGENYSITQVNRNISVLYSGNVVINDKIHLEGELPENIVVGFPIRYGANLLEVAAYDSSYTPLQVIQGIHLEGQRDFYCVNVKLTDTDAQVLTVIFIFSNNLLSPTSNGYSLDFPDYPSLTKPVGKAAVQLSLPSAAHSVIINKNDEAMNMTSYQKDNLSPFSSSSVQATFSITSGVIQKVTIPSITRIVDVTPSGSVSCADTYQIRNNSSRSIGTFKINLPLDASNVIIKDISGRTLPSHTEKSTRSLLTSINFSIPINPGESSTLKATYDLPSVLTESGIFVLPLEVVPYFDYFVGDLTVNVTPPEGAKITSPTYDSVKPYTTLSRQIFQESLTIKKLGVSYIDNLFPKENELVIKFTYNPLWASFRPTFWILGASLLGSLIVGLFKRSKVTPKTKIMPKHSVPEKSSTDSSSEALKAFTFAYEDKNKTLSNLKALETRARKSRLPRRRYKVNKRNLENRLKMINQTIAEKIEILKSSGQSYSDLIKQIQLLESEINELDSKIKNAEARYQAGISTLEEYRKEIADLDMRKTRVENAVNGIILRLRGEFE